MPCAMVRFVVISEADFSRVVGFINGGETRLNDRPIGKLITELYQKVEIVRERIDDREQSMEFINGIL